MFEDLVPTTLFAENEEDFSEFKKLMSVVDHDSLLSSKVTTQVLALTVCL